MEAARKPPDSMNCKFTKYEKTKLRDDVFEGRWKLSGSLLPIVSMMQSAEPRLLDKYSITFRSLLDFSLVRGVFLQRKMCSVIMVIIDVLFHYLVKMLFINDDVMIDCFSFYRSHKSFAMCVHLWSSRCSEYFFDTHVFYSVPEVFAKDAVSVMKKVAWHSVQGKCFYESVCSPFSRWMLCNAIGNNLPSVQIQYDKAV